ncbi:MAG: hypothetical protein ABJB34_10345 [Acidobacteriota bacterium]
MNKKLWLGIYLVSAAIFYLSLFAMAVMGIMLFDELVSPQAILGLMITAGVLGYAQFLVSHTAITLSLLYRNWDALQDGVTQVSPGKAIGFLFIPFYNIYWVFRVWAGYPKDYNEFVARNGLSTPRLPGTFHTLFPVAILLTAVLILPLLILPIITLFLISRSCDAVNNLLLARSAKSEGRSVSQGEYVGTPENPRSKAPLFAMAALVVVGGLIGLGFGTFAYFNLFPKPSDEVVPAKVGAYTLQPGGYSKGSILGLRADYVDRVYVEDGGANKAIRYNVNLFPTEAEPKRRIESICAKETSAAITDSAGNQVGKYCSSSGSIFMHNGSKYMWITAPLGSDADKYKGGKPEISELVEFAKALPLNKGTVFAELSGISSSTSVSSTSTSITSSPTGGATSVSKDAAADFTFSAEELYKATNGKSTAELAKYSAKIIQVTARKYSDTSTSVMLQAGTNSFFANYEPSESSSFTQAKKDDRLVIKCEAEAKYTFSLKRCVLAENRKIIAPNDTPDFTFTADEFWNKVASYNLPAGERSKQFDELRTKVVKISGTVHGVSGNMANLSAGGTNTISCKPDPENAGMFSSLSDGQSVTFLAVHGVADLEHCIVISK